MSAAALIKERTTSQQKHARIARLLAAIGYQVTPATIAGRRVALVITKAG